MSCALCQKDLELRRSHIIPEFLYKAMYDEKHRFHVISVIPEQQDWMEQKGLREYLLCDDCETRISRFEDYGRKVLMGGTEFRFRREGSAVTVEGLDYKQFKLFQLSILWRSGISKLQMFENVRLGRFEEILRKMLLHEQPGTQDSFGCVMFGLKDNAGVTDGLLVQPTNTRTDGHLCYRFIFGGFMWVYFVSGHPKTGEYVVGFLQESGRLSFVIKNIFETKMITNFARKRTQLGRVA